MSTPDSSETGPNTTAEPVAPIGESSTDGATLERGTYDILRDRLRQHADALASRAEQLNEKRLALFGDSEMAVIGNERIRTENNCVPRDIVPVGELLLFGYNVFIGLRSETRVEDVLSLHRWQATDDGFQFERAPEEAHRALLGDPRFVSDFQELYRYYKETRLLQLRRGEGKILAVFQTGASVHDIKVFRWAVDHTGTVTYLDNRGERDHVFPPAWDFEWTATTRDQHVAGSHPHVNVLDQVFVETVGGDLTVKVEDNTDDGLGIYREVVDEPDQALADGDIHYAQVGTLILLKVLPYKEKTWRYLVFNTRTQRVDRIDAIGLSCRQLPEDHGLVFPGGYYLQDGETKTFEGDLSEMELKRMVRSPNGEDVLYVFHQRADGRYILLTYNLIRKQVANPIHCHGFGFFEDGKLMVFRSLSEEAVRVHPVQIWQTPFTSEEHAARVSSSSGTFLEKVGNNDLVRGISDAFSLRRSATETSPTLHTFEDLIAGSGRALDAYYWLDHDEVGDLRTPLLELRATAEQMVDEFEKVESLRAASAAALQAAADELDGVVTRTRDVGISAEERSEPGVFVEGLADLRRQRGHLIGLRERRYIDLERIDELEASAISAFEDLSRRTVELFQSPEALAPFHEQVEAIAARGEATETVADANPALEDADRLGENLALLTEVVSGLEVGDATVRTAILSDISSVLGALNQARARVDAHRRELLTREGKAEFAAQLQLLQQSMAGALALADTPEACDDQLARLMLRLEEIEGAFGEIDSFLDEITTRREDIYEAFSARKQTLMDERHRQASRWLSAGERVLGSVARRAATFTDADQLSTFFASDPMVDKLRGLTERLRSVGDSVKADELDARLAAARQDAARSLRDRGDLFEEGADVIRLGRHRFSVTSRPVELTMVPVDGRMTFVLTGTDYQQPVDAPALDERRAFWEQTLVSETGEVYRGETLASSLLAEAETAGRLDTLRQEAHDPALLVPHVQRHMAERYDEGYERGVHDQDAALILSQLLGLYSTAGRLRFSSRARALASLFWAFQGDEAHADAWRFRARSLARLREVFGPSPATVALQAELSEHVGRFAEAQGLDVSPVSVAGVYLFEELAHEPIRFIVSGEAMALRGAFFEQLTERGEKARFEEDQTRLADDLRRRHQLVTAWMRAFVEHGDAAPTHVNPGAEEPGPPQRAGHGGDLAEAVALVLTEGHVDHEPTSVRRQAVVEGLLGRHPRVRSRQMVVRIDEFLARLDAFRTQRIPGFRRFQALRHELLEAEREHLRLDEYRPRVMSAFVRNQLIDQVYLPLIGDNLAKQLGALGESKRTDQMGLLLLISPPGYGKTTLMEYVASRLGLAFVKVNGPSLGHDVTSLDPAEAPNATARQEVEKISLALEMGNNVLLYLDDIQHTSSELLQKFISLCDAQRRMEGVWRGKTRTYDLRGKRFAVCMAGNPYTESGERFQIPDMLANRADTYNLGDILDGKESLFALSYIENALTSNPVLAPLSTRDPADVGKLVRLAAGEDVPLDQLAHGYNSVEIEEILSVLRKLLTVQKTLLQVNQAYIASASQDDAFRTEPRFQLQGSYRNMNRLAEKIVPVMNDDELEALIDDHYVGEAQTLTAGAEHNLLKLAELRGRMSDEQAARWNEVKRGFARLQALGGGGDDPVGRVVGQLGLMSQQLGALAMHAERHEAEPSNEEVEDGTLSQELARFHDVFERLVQATAMEQASASKESIPPVLEGIVDGGFDRLAEVLAEASAVRSSAPATTVDLTPYLDGLEKALEALAQSPRGTHVVQHLEPGVRGLLGRTYDEIETTLMPAIKDLSKGVATNREQKRLLLQLDKALHGLDLLRDLVAALRKIDTASFVQSETPPDETVAPKG